MFLDKETKVNSVIFLTPIAAYGFKRKEFAQYNFSFRL